MRIHQGPFSQAAGDALYIAKIGQGQAIAGSLIINDPLPTSANGTALELNSIQSSLLMVRYGAHVLPPNILMQKSRGLTLGSLVKVQAGDFLSQIRQFGIADDNATMATAAREDVIVPAGGVPGGATHVAADRLWSSTDIAGNFAERMRLVNDGTLRVASLAGVGVRAVVADAAGNLSAP